VGAYSIVPTLNDPAGKLGNYTVSLQNGILTVNPATLTGRADNQSRLYGQANLPFTVTYSGFVNGDTTSVVIGTLVGSSPAQTNSPVGTYPIRVSGQGAANYTIQYEDGTLSVGPAPLVVQAADASRAYGQTNPVFTASLSGFVNGEGSNVLGGQLVFSSPAQTNSPVGTYPIVAGGLSATNYSLSYSNGTLTVTAYALSVKADDQSRSYGSANPLLTGSLVGVQDGDNISASFSTAATAGSPVGTYRIAPMLSVPAGKLSNYTVHLMSGTLTVTPAPLAVSADAQSKVYGTGDPPLTCHLTSGALMDGDKLSGSLSRMRGEHAGSYAIQQGTLTAGSNYTLTYVGADLTITRANSSGVVTSSANPSLPGSDVTFTVVISAVSPGSGTPTGSVRFRLDGSALGAAAVSSGGMASVTWVGPSPGSHIVRAEYAGDGDFVGTTNSLTPNQVVDSAPVGGTHALTAFENTPAGLSVAVLAGGGTNEDLKPLTIKSVSARSTSGGTVAFSGSMIIYVPPANYIGSDSFTYTVSDSLGATATGTVVVTVKPANVILSGCEPQPDGNFKLTGRTTPNRIYLMEASTDLAHWTALSTNVADPNGWIQFVDLNATNHPFRFYRTATP